MMKPENVKIESLHILSIMQSKEMDIFLVEVDLAVAAAIQEYSLSCTPLRCKDAHCT